MEKQVLENFESMLQEASQLFSDHYGIWGEHAAQVNREFAKADKSALQDGTICIHLADALAFTKQQVFRT